MKRFFLMMFIVMINSVHAQDDLSKYNSDNFEEYSDWYLRDSSTKITGSTLSKDILVENIWYLGNFDNSFIGVGEKGRYLLMFYMDDVFYIGSRQAGIMYKGNYKIEGNNVDLVFSQNTDNVKVLANLDRLLLRFTENSNNLFTKHWLSSEKYSIFFYPSMSSFIDNDIININDIEFVVLKDKYVVTDNLKFRKGPDISYENINVDNHDYEMWNMKFLLPGTIIKVKARTTKKVKIGNWENYWYYISVPEYEFEIDGFVFGEFIERCDSNKMNYYFQLQKNAIDKINGVQLAE